MTSVPILSPDEDDGRKMLPGVTGAGAGGGISSRGNLRSEGSKGLRDLKKSNAANGSNTSLNRKSSIIDR